MHSEEPKSVLHSHCAYGASLMAEERCKSPSLSSLIKARKNEELTFSEGMVCLYEDFSMRLYHRECSRKKNLNKGFITEKVMEKKKKLTHFSSKTSF